MEGGREIESEREGRGEEQEGKREREEGRRERNREREGTEIKCFGLMGRTKLAVMHS